MRLVRASVALILIFVGLGSRAQADVPNCSDGSISQISDSALRTVAASGRDACLIECERYYQENPKARPASTKRTCEGFWRRAVSQVKLENQIRLRAACASGVWTGVLSLPESLRAYSLMVGNVGEALATAHREGWEFAERCQKDIACRRETARLLVRFRERRTDGSYLVPDAQVDREIASMNYRTLLTQVGQNQASLRQVCTQELERINFKVGPREDGRWTSAQLLERYRTMAAFDPACVGALGLLPPEMSASGPANPGRDWLESLGIQWQCYEPERAQELFCMEVAAFVVDPMAVLPAGNLALKAVAKAGLRRITRTAATSEVAVNSRVARQRVDEGAEVGGARVTDLTRSEARQRYNAQHLHKQFTTEVQNEVWISAAQAIRPKAGRRFLDVENAVMKALNDRLRDKNFVTSLTNRQKEILLGKIQKLLDETPGVQMLPYSDFKAMRFAFDGRLPADFEKRLARAVRSANDEFVDELRALKLVREG
ncbi:MAG: hypothetical protein NDI61_12675, partial [Bdellovibrionaceae bacterium]|nr:hypothetical protein [Pseudobdellovibrionaceae bacterium]